MTKPYNQTKPFTLKQADLLWWNYENHLKRAVSPAHREDLIQTFGASLAAWNEYSMSLDAVPIVPSLRKPSVKWLLAIRRYWKEVEHPEGFTTCETCGKVYNVNYIGTHRSKKHVR